MTQNRFSAKCQQKQSLKNMMSIALNGTFIVTWYLTVSSSLASSLGVPCSLLSRVFQSLSLLHLQSWLFERFGIMDCSCMVCLASRSDSFFMISAKVSSIRGFAIKFFSCDTLATKPRFWFSILLFFPNSIKLEIL